MEKDENESVADQMNRGLFLAPDLIGEDEDDPLLEQAEENVDAEADEIESRNENEAEKERRRP